MQEAGGEKGEAMQWASTSSLRPRPSGGRGTCSASGTWEPSVKGRGWGPAHPSFLPCPTTEPTPLHSGRVIHPPGASREATPAQSSCLLSSQIGRRCNLTELPTHGRNGHQHNQVWGHTIDRCDKVAPCVMAFHPGLVMEGH